MRSVDLTGDFVAIAKTLRTLVSGAQDVALVSRWDNEIGRVSHDSEDLGSIHVDDIVVTVSRKTGESDESLADRLAARFFEAVDDV